MQMKVRELDYSNSRTQSVKEPLFLLSENRGITIFGYKYE